MAPFRVAISGDFVGPDGKFAYPDFDLAPLRQDPNVELAFTPADKTLRGADLAGFDALILLGIRFDRSSVPEDGRLAVVARFGVGYDNVDVPACSDNGIAVVITPDGIRRPVAVSIITLMLALTGKLLAKDRLTRMGPEGWAQRSRYMGVGTTGRTLGSIGLGNIASELFRLARPFEMRFVAHDPYADPVRARELGVELLPLEEVFRQSDILAVNCFLNAETRHLVNAERLALMKPTAYLINTARGPIVDQRALVEALRAGRIAGAGLDVFEEEPTPADEEILTLDNVVLAPHSLCWTDECFAGNGAADVRAVFDVMHGRVPVGIVNRNVVDNPTWRNKLDRYREQFGG